MARYEVKVQGKDKGFSGVLTVAAKHAEAAIHEVRFGVARMYDKDVAIVSVELIDGEVEFDEDENKDEMIEF